MLRILLVFVYLLFISNAIASEFEYIVKTKDTLSNIIFINFPDKRIYGPKGLLHQLRSLNPHVQNLDRIYVGQKIIFPYELHDFSRMVSTEKSVEEKVEEDFSNHISSPAEFLPIKNSDFSLKFLYGILFTSTDQKSGFNQINFDSIKSAYKISAHYQFTPEASLNTKYERMTLKGYALDKKHEINFSNIQTYAIYKHYIFGFKIKESAIALLFNGQFSFIKESQKFLSLGWHQEWIKFNEIKMTWNNMANIPLAASGSVDIKIDSFSGYDFTSNFEIQKTFIQRENYKFFGIWENEFSYVSTKRHLKSNRYSGELKDKTINYSTYLGIGFTF